MRESCFAVRPPGDDSSRDAHRRTFLCGSQHRLRLRRCVLTIEPVSVGSYVRLLQGFEFLTSRLENEVQLVAHAAAVVEPPPCFRYASMNGSIPPSITFWTSGIL